MKVYIVLFMALAFAVHSSYGQSKSAFPIELKTAFGGERPVKFAKVLEHYEGQLADYKWIRPCYDTLKPLVTMIDSTITSREDAVKIRNSLDFVLSQIIEREADDHFNMMYASMIQIIDAQLAIDSLIKISNSVKIDKKVAKMETSKNINDAELTDSKKSSSWPVFLIILLIMALAFAGYLVKKKDNQVKEKDAQLTELKKDKKWIETEKKTLEAQILELSESKDSNLNKESEQEEIIKNLKKEIEELTKNDKISVGMLNMAPVKEIHNESKEQQTTIYLSSPEPEGRFHNRPVDQSSSKAYYKLTLENETQGQLSVNSENKDAINRLTTSQDQWISPVCTIENPEQIGVLRQLMTVRPGRAVLQGNEWVVSDRDKMVVRLT